MHTWQAVKKNEPTIKLCEWFFAAVIDKSKNIHQDILQTWQYSAHKS